MLSNFQEVCQMKKGFVYGLFFFAIIVGCSSENSSEQQAERLLLITRDLEEEFDVLPKAIARYAEIAAKYPETEAGKRAGQRQNQLLQLQEKFAGTLPEKQDSLVAFYESAIPIAPDYFALLKKLGIIYYNQTALSAPSAVKTRFSEMRDYTVEVWGKQDLMWKNYAFRPVQSNRIWQDRLCGQALGVTEMLISRDFSDYDRGYDVVQRALVYGNSEDVRAKAKVLAAFCSFRKAKNENLREGISLANEALTYEFLGDEERARAYHVIGLCYTYLHQDSGDLADLDAAIKALNECVNIDSGMSEARDLLKTLRQTREKLPS